MIGSYRRSPTAGQPYVGVSGFMSRSEVESTLAILDQHPMPGRLLMVGVLVSQKTLGGARNRYPRRYPPIEDVASIFVGDPRCLNLVHYASDQPPTLADLLRLEEYAGAHCHGLQLNGAWPTPAALRCRGKACVVLQARPSASGIYPSWPVVARAYQGLATDVLLDASGGRGLRLDPVELAVHAAALRQTWSSVGIGVAGGLCAEMLPAVANLMRDGCSIDAEGRLRDGAEGGGELDLDKVRAYLRAAAQAAAGARSMQDGGHGPAEADAGVATRRTGT